MWFYMYFIRPQPNIYVELSSIFHNLLSMFSHSSFKRRIGGFIPVLLTRVWTDDFFHDRNLAQELLRKHIREGKKLILSSMDPDKTGKRQRSYEEVLKRLFLTLRI